MTSKSGVPRRLPSRPVADAPVDALLARSEGLTKGWLLALLEQRNLQDAPAIVATDMVRDGPRLCDAIVRALADDDDLQRLEPGGAFERLASRAGEMAGTSHAEPSVRAVDALRAVIWSALREELVRPDADHVEALAERLALVTELVRGAVLRRFAGTEDGTVEDGPRTVADASRASDAPRASDADVPLEGGGPRLAAVDPERIDDVADLAVALGAAAPADGAAGVPGLARDAGAARDAPRSVTADSLWRGALEDEVARAQRSGAKLALLLAEMSDADRVSAAEPLHVARETFGRFAQAVRSALRREDILACETESRAWIIARTTGRTGARALGARIATAVQEAEPWRGAPLTVGIGIAVLGEDAHDAVGLIEAADEWTFAAVSAGVATAEAPSNRDDGSAGGSPRILA